MVNSNTFPTRVICRRRYGDLGRQHRVARACCDRCPGWDLSALGDQTAAAYCGNLVLNGYDDWFLPSDEELQYFRNNMSFTQSLSYVIDMYWTSSEASANEAYFIVIGGGASFDSYDKMIGKPVLPMRRF